MRLVLLVLAFWTLCVMQKPACAEEMGVGEPFLSDQAEVESPEPLSLAELDPEPHEKGYDIIEKLEKRQADQQETASSEEEMEEGIADPFEPLNRAVFHFNDKVYFWFWKPLGVAYKAVFPEPVRVGVRNFFYNVTFPVRFVNCLLQGKGDAAQNSARHLLR